jgi:hypothetical protein
MHPLRRLVIAAAVSAVAAVAQNPVTADSPFQVGYAITLAPVTSSGVGPAVVASSQIFITNTGANGSPLNGPGIGTASGNICANVYAFSPDEQLISCCSCLITPNGLSELIVANDLTSNPLTGVVPPSIVVKLVSTLAGTGGAGTSCTNSAAVAGSTAFPLAAGMAAWSTTVHSIPPLPLAVTEVPFTPSTLSAAELASLNNRCTGIIGNGSGFGICRSCRIGVPVS